MSFIVQNGGNEYENKKVHLKQRLEEANITMIDVLKRMGINLVNFISLGNSVATGYSASDTIKPLFARNESLEELLNINSIDVNFYNFCRAQKNTDANIFEWLEKDYTASQINMQNLVALTLNKDNINKSDFPVDSENDRTFKDINTNVDESGANIVVYNGGTGAFLDYATRGTPLKALGGFNEDFSDMRAVLRKIYTQNPNTQVYVCGIPGLLALKKPINLLLNHRMRKVCEEFPNVVYVNPTPVHCLYRNKEGERSNDFHPNEPEYLNLMHNIISSISENYIKTAFCAEMYSKLAKVADDAQYVDGDLRWNNDYIMNTVLPPIIEKYNYLFEDKKQLKEAYERFITMFKSKYAHDFYFIKKQETVNKLDETKKAL